MICPHCHRDIVESEPFALDGDTKKGTRWPPDAKVPEHWKKWAKQARPDVDVENEAIMFANYWSSLPETQDARKKNWAKTWQNRILGLRRNGFGQPTPRVNPSPAAPVERRAPRTELSDSDRAKNAARLEELMRGLAK